MKSDDLSHWKAFLAVAQHGNFARASRELRIPVSILSKRVAALEQQLGVRLFQRSTRVVNITDEGLALQPRIRALLDELHEVEHTFSQEKQLSGTVRVTCVPFLAHTLLLPIFTDFRRLHPNIKIELSLSEAIVNIIESNFDLAIRIQTPQDSDLIYRRLAANDLVFCASPKYLRDRKAIHAPEDLLHHDLLFLKLHEGCKFQNSQLQLKKFSSRKVLECDNGAFLKDLALRDNGVLVRSVWDVKEDFKSGRLIQVLKKYPLETFGHIHAVIPSKKFLAPRSRAFYEFVLDRSKKW